MRTQQKTTWLIAAVSAFVLGGSALGFAINLGISWARSNGEGKNEAGEESAAVLVTVAPVTLRSIHRAVPVVGTLHGQEEVTITPKVEGRVLRIHHDVGDVVRPGEVLLEIDPTDCRLAVDEAGRALELELSRLGLKELPPEGFDLERLPTVERARHVEENASRKLERRLPLSVRGVSSVEDLEQVETDLKIARASVQQAVLEARAALAAVRYRQALLATAQERLKDCLVRAPQPAPPGVTTGCLEYAVAQRLLSEGEMVRGFPSMPAFRLVVDHNLKLLATVPERHTGEVRVGQAVQVRVEAFPETVFLGTVSRLNPTIDPATRAFQTEVLIPNEARQLRAGGFAKATILTRIEAEAPTVPLEGLVTTAGVTKVFIVEDGTAHEVPIQTGVSGRGWVEARGDLPAGCAVVTSGQSKLAEGTPVRLPETTSGGVGISQR